MREGPGCGVQGSGLGPESPHHPIAPPPRHRVTPWRLRGPEPWLLPRLRRLRPFFLVAVPLGGLLVARPVPPLYLAGVALAALGQALRFWAAGHIRKEETLAVDGPYALTRNPLYAGSLLISLGWAAMSGRAVPAAAILLAYAATHWPTILAEEERLRERFGDAYEAYCRRAPRWFGGMGVRACVRVRGAHPHAPQRSGNFSWRLAIYRNREGRSAVGVALLTLAYGTRLWW